MSKSKTSNSARYCANCGGERIVEKNHPIIEAIAYDFPAYCIGTAITGAIVGIFAMGFYESKTGKDLEKERIKAGYILYTGDINGSGSLDDKFYLIDGKPAVVELDGRPIAPNPKLDNLLTSEKP